MNTKLNKTPTAAEFESTIRNIVDRILLSLENDFNTDMLTLAELDCSQNYTHIFINDAIQVCMITNTNEHFNLEGMIKIFQVGQGGYSCACDWCNRDANDFDEGYTFSDFFCARGLYTEYYNMICDSIRNIFEQTSLLDNYLYN